MSIPIIGDILKAGGDIFRSWNDGRTRIKEAKIEAKVKRWEAEGKRAEKEADAERDWDMEALKGSQKSYKDEVIATIWFTPFIMLFIPGLQPYALAGFAALASVPYGYWLVLFGIVAQAFGLRWLFQKRIEKSIKSVKEFKQ